jgi:hypothetical protein
MRALGTIQVVNSQLRAAPVSAREHTEVEERPRFFAAVSLGVDIRADCRARIGESVIADNQ